MSATYSSTTFTAPGIIPATEATSGGNVSLSPCGLIRSKYRVTNPVSVMPCRDAYNFAPNSDSRGTLTVNLAVAEAIATPIVSAVQKAKRPFSNVTLTVHKSQMKLGLNPKWHFGFSETNEPKRKENKE